HPDGDAVLPSGFSFAASENRITQIPALVVHKPIQPIRATQLLYLLVHKPIQATRVTQIPVLPLTKPKPIPLPGVVVPEVPVSEVWDYKTVINEAIGSREQRAMLRASPRQRLSFDVVVGNDEERRAVFQMLFAYQKIV